MLIPAYNLIKQYLQPQIQGTCGIYSFYNAVCILRQINNLNPIVPPPKKSYFRQVSHTSLREYSKRQLLSGQGEILSTLEMSGLLAAHGYAPLALNRIGGVSDTDKKEFINMCMREGYPVLVAYLADQDQSGVIYTTNSSAVDAGAHWSLIIGISKDGMTLNVIEPNAPQALKTWSFTDLMLANKMSDSQKFARFWAKTKITTNNLTKKTSKLDTSIDKIGSNINQWNPYQTKQQGRNQQGDKVVIKTDYVDTYDLGGSDGSRQDNQDLSNVLIAIIPPAKS